MSKSALSHAKTDEQSSLSTQAEVSLQKVISLTHRVKHASFSPDGNYLRCVLYTLICSSFCIIGIALQEIMKLLYMKFVAISYDS